MTRSLEADGYSLPPTPDWVLAGLQSEVCRQGP